MAQEGDSLEPFMKFFEKILDKQLKTCYNNLTSVKGVLFVLTKALLLKST